ncbi:hypothetical protein SA496_01295 [Pseudomonas sp. JS3066]|uniref:hypothetical protein n=1 Tax=Pseudomonas sp. JS3066 TaxID=3090665 RepID=UPI002E7C1A9C|nr:hypothetical protein [Pseudomonas sp. JS3066]WVK96424.1 hypothetical protein SA496_01295 [Pseudomonas sp. JS3066]
MAARAPVIRLNGRFRQLPSGDWLPIAAGGTGATNAPDARAALGLGNVDNTSDLGKPISTATQAALNAKQNALGYNPVQQGTGAGQLGNNVKIGWSAGGLLLTIDATDFANNWPISISKNAATATKLATARTINGVAFDGSANITITDDTKMAPGAYGVGGVMPVITDANAIAAGGLYNLGSPYTNGPSATFHHILHAQASTTASEIALTSNTTSPKASIRGFASGAWGAWLELARLAFSNTWVAKQIFNEYTQLGDTAPAIKQKKLTGTTAATEGGTVSASHGVTSSKVIGVQVLVFHSSTNAILPGWVASAGYQYDVQLTSTGVQVVLHPTNSENILSKSFAVLITYEE